jgi:RNA polymerase sigma-70 factor, ECF subfamily
LQTDEELMLLYQNGSVEAFEELYIRYNSKVYGYLKKRLNSNDAIEDLFQKIFMRLHEQKDKFNKGYLFAPWLFTITRNILIDWYRVKKHIPTDQIEYLKDMQIEDKKEEHLAVNEVVELLPLKYKQAIQLRYSEGFEFNEIAKALNLTESNARKLVSRGLGKLKALLTGAGK